MWVRRLIKDRCYNLFVFWKKKHYVAKTNLYERKILNTNFSKSTAVGNNFKGKHVWKRLQKQGEELDERRNIIICRNIDWWRVQFCETPRKMNLCKLIQRNFKQNVMLSNESGAKSKTNHEKAAAWLQRVIQSGTKKFDDTNWWY